MAKDMRKKPGGFTLLDAIRYFKNPQHCIDFMVQAGWPNGVICPTCGSKDVTWLPNQWRWYCVNKHPQRQFSAKVGTIMEDSPISLSKWLPAIWLLTNCKNGVSSYEISRDLDVTQTTAWFMMHRIRKAMQSGTFEKKMGENGGPVEADETFIGGLARFMHKDKRAKKITGTGGSGKSIVMGLLDRHTRKVRVKHVENTRRETLHGEIRTHVAPGATVNTDEWVGYKGMPPEYVHNVINHAEAYVNGSVHTNGIENFWSLLSRMIKGTYVSVEPFHLFRYLDEEAFRFNEREGTDAERFLTVLGSLAGKRLTYKELIGENPEPTTAGLPA